MSLVNGDLTAARASVAQEVAFDVLTKTQEADNEQARQEVSRSFLFPTKDMYQYAVLASVGDDVYHEPCMLALEAHMAKLTGKEAALFLPSGTMSNQIALRTHLKQPPYSVLCDQRAHINNYEAGGTAFHSGAHSIPVMPSNNQSTHLMISSPTEVVALENTLNGTIIPQDEVVRIADFVHNHGVKMHLDGARIWHVAAETGTSLKELLEPFDSVSLCFSKGLVGSKDYIRKARWFRKLFGGGMRQIGFLAASAAYALTYNFPQLPRTHQLAKRLEQGLVDLGVKILSHAETCMVFFDPTPLGISYVEIVTRAAELPSPIKLGGSRLVVHIQTSPQAVDDLLALIRQLADEKKQNGYVPPEEEVDTNGAPFSNIYVRAKKH
ncbi:hypothetical protein EIP86_005242 [Pleurotus ostreatoroseus]|nr:hypothetical protein EIP86_005242 [Pleurotus ostreatoroseus]